MSKESSVSPVQSPVKKKDKTPQILNVNILVSTEDPASQMIKRQLLAGYHFRKNLHHPMLAQKSISTVYSYQLPESNDPNIQKVLEQHEEFETVLDFSLLETTHSMISLDAILNPEDMVGDLMIVASRHQSKSNRHSLLCHTPGNFDKDNSAGGQPKQTAKGSGLLSHYFFSNLEKLCWEREFDVKVDHEVNHHGPTGFSLPVIFIEQGSIETHWQNQKGARIIADTIIHGCKELAQKHYSDGGWDSKQVKICVGFGGTHYMPSFSPLIPEGFGFAHTIPKYKVEALNDHMIDHIQERTAESIDYWVLDWKGMNSDQKKHLMPLLEATDIPIKKARKLRHKHDVSHNSK